MVGKDQSIPPHLISINAGSAAAPAEGNCSFRSERETIHIVTAAQE